MVRVIDGALPDALVARARRAISRLGGERFRESYFTTFWLPRGVPARNVIEEAVLALSRVAGVRCGGCEWWIGRAYTDRLPIEFHFDHDVKGRKARHPLRSSVFFFNAVRGGHLVVTDQTARMQEATRIESVKPRRNRYALLRGDVLHGVMGTKTRGRLRVTLVVNYWDRRPTGVPTWAESGIYRSLR